MKINNYNKLIELVTLHKELRQPKKLASRKDILNSMFQLEELYKHQYKRRNAEFSKELNKNPFLISPFSLMQYNFHENTHSNILEYLFNYEMIGENAVRILTAFLKKIETSSVIDLICSKVEKRNYKIQREYPINYGGRPGFIDLVIYDETNKFLIVIENKLLAKVREINEEVGTQLDLYRNYIEQNFKDYHKLFILLSFKDLGEHEGFNTANYYQVFEAIEGDTSGDNILIEYNRLLFLILNGIKTNKIMELKKAVHDFEFLTLHMIEILKKYKYETQGN